MALFIIGLDYQKAALSIREQAAVVDSHLLTTLGDSVAALSSQAGLVILSTCNRTEWIAECEDPEALVNQFCGRLKATKQQAQAYVYMYANTEALTHICHVAIGLESMVIGEPQILGQLKHAVRMAQQAKTLSPKLQQHIERVFYIAKKVRTETTIGHHVTSLGYAVTKIAKQIFGQLTSKTALVLATGDMNLLIAQHLLENGCSHLLICNRTPANAERFVQQLALRYPQVKQAHTLVPLDQLAQVLHRADIISASSASEQPLIDKHMVEQALKQRKHAPLFMVDLAVPRDIDPQVAELDDVFLHTIDDLQMALNDNSTQRQHAAHAARAYTANLLTQQRNVQLQAQLQNSSIVEYRQNVEMLRVELVEAAIAALAKGEPATEVVALLSKQLSQKLMHPVLLALKSYATLPTQQRQQLTSVLLQPNANNIPK